MKQLSPAPFHPQRPHSSAKDELIMLFFDEIRLVRRDCNSCRGPRSPGGTDDEPGMAFGKYADPLAVQSISVQCLQSRRLHHDMFLVCRWLFHASRLYRGWSGMHCRTAVAVVAIKFGGIGTYKLSKSCQAVQRYCSSAVIMIGALQVVLEGMRRQLLFLSDARSPTPASGLTPPAL